MQAQTTPQESPSQSRNSALPPSSSVVRPWGTAAQRNLRNQWSKLNSLCHDWRSASAAGRSHATAIVNSYLSQKYMDGMDFGVLSDMPNIRKKASSKLLRQQKMDFEAAATWWRLQPVIQKQQQLEFCRGRLLSSYRDMVAVVTRMVNTCKSMRCYFRGTINNSLAQFSFSSEDDSDSGDCGGIPVFTFCSIASFEELAWEIVGMFILELNLKRLLVMEILSIHDEKVAEAMELRWSDELYEGEFNDMSIFNLYSKESHEPVLPRLQNCSRSSATLQSKKQQDSNVLQVYITTWLVEVNIDGGRVDEIFAIVGGEMHVDSLEAFGV